MTSNVVWLRLAEGLLEFLAPFQPEVAGPDQVDVDGDFPHGNDHQAIVAGIDAVDVPLVFAHLIAQELVLERQVAERGYFFDSTFDYGLVVVPDDHGHVVCRVGAVVGHVDGRSLLVELEPPVVDRLVGGDGERSLADRVRVATYLVCLGCKAVCFGCDPYGFFSDPVGFLSEGVCVLGELVRLARLNDGDSRRDETKDAGDGPDDGNDRGKGLAPLHSSCPSRNFPYKKNAAAGTCGSDKRK